MRNGKSNKWSIMMSALGIVSIASGVALAQVGAPPNFNTDNPSPFPYVHTGVNGSGTQLTGAQLITVQGTMGSGNFFQQEFVTVNPGGAGAGPAIHTMLEGASIGKSFVQESFVMLNGQRPPTVQNNTPSPILSSPPDHTSISFRQSVKDNGFSTTASLDPLQDIHIHQQNASPDPVNGQSGGLSFSNVSILPNRTGPNGEQHATDPSCGTGAGAPVFCTTIDQQVRVLQGATVIFTQDMDFTTGGLPTIVQGP